MFKWLTGRREKRSSVQLCMPLLKSTDGVSAQRVLTAWAKLFPLLPRLMMEKDGTTSQEASEVMLLNAAGAGAFIALVPTPVPSDEIQEARAYSWMWDAKYDKALASYGAHAIVGSTDVDRTAVENAVLISRIAACVLKAAGEGALGVYWGNAGLIHTANNFVEMIGRMPNESEPVPPLWINVFSSRAGPGGPWSFSTFGMNSFGHDEFEIVNVVAHQPGEYVSRLFDIANYVMEHGPVLKHGHTFGANEYERIKIRVGKSKLGKPGRVIRLEF